MVNTGAVSRKRIRESPVDRVFSILIVVLSLFSFLVILVPLLHVISCSLSSGQAVQSGQVGIFPVEFTTTSYQMVFDYKDVWIGYRNTLLYTVVGTALNILFTILMAYPLSRKDLKGCGLIMKLMVFTMMFSGGLIPNYLLVKDLHLLNTAWSLWLPGLISVYNVIVMRTFFKSTIPAELLEAAQIDGCTNRRFLWSIVLPLSGTIVAVMVLLYAIGHWNNYFSAMLYISDKNKYPLQLFLREILISSQIDYSAMTGSTMQEMLKKQEMRLLIKYSLIVVSSLPILCIYPFIQKYLVKGVLIGSIKG